MTTFLKKNILSLNGEYENFSYVITTQKNVVDPNQMKGNVFQWNVPRLAWREIYVKKFFTGVGMRVL